MLTEPRRRLVRRAAWALAVVLGGPALAEAQLFPNHQIKRQRTPCCQENPIYGLYRRQYYGYFPTCWRRFPPGWGCPSPEAPSSAAAMEEIRRMIEAENAAAEEEPGMEQPDEGTEPTEPRRIPLPTDEPPPFVNPGEPPPRETSTEPPQATLEPFGTEDGPAPIQVPARASAAPGRRPRAASPALPPLDMPVILPDPPTTGEESSAAPLLGPTAPRRGTLIGGLVENLRGRRRR
jgi:hypothetical protein